MPFKAKVDIYELFTHGYRFLVPALVADLELATFVESQERERNIAYVNIKGRLVSFLSKKIDRRI